VRSPACRSSWSTACTSSQRACAQSSLACAPFTRKGRRPQRNDKWPTWRDSSPRQPAPKLGRSRPWVTSRPWSGGNKPKIEWAAPVLPLVSIETLCGIALFAHQPPALHTLRPRWPRKDPVEGNSSMNRKLLRFAQALGWRGCSVQGRSLSNANVLSPIPES